MSTDQDKRKFKSGLRLCWISLVTLPLGFLAIGGGPCAGPRNIAGSVILLSVGGFGACAALFGASRIVRDFRAVRVSMRMWGILSICLAAFVGFVGGTFLVIGVWSLEAFVELNRILPKLSPATFLQFLLKLALRHVR